MNIQSLLGNNASTLSGSVASASQASNAVGATASVLSKAGQRIQTDVDATTAQLSKFGLLKSAVSSSQLAARALTGLSATATASELTSAVAKFFNGFNAAVSAAQSASAAPASMAAAQSASRVSSDLKRALSLDPGTVDAMKKLGLTVQRDATMLHDPQKFANAVKTDPAGVRAALATLGKRVDAATTTELAKNGVVDTGLSSLNQRASALAAQQKAIKTLDAAMGTGTNYRSSSLAAYRSNSV